MEPAQELHPNWRALATIHLPLKRFLREGTLNLEKGVRNDRGQKYEIQNVDAAEVVEFYKTVTTKDERLSDSSTQSATKSNIVGSIQKQPSTQKPQKLKPFEEKQFFRYAMENDANGLQQLRYKADDINTRDNFDWTALMMAACAGSSEAVEILLKLGARTDLKEKAGRTAQELATIKGQHDIVEMLNSKDDSYAMQPNESQEAVASSVFAPYFCETCKRQFKETNYQAHLTSTIHQFNTRSGVNANKLQKFNIPQQNRGLQLMVKQGWDKESGLGPSNSGRLYPVKTVIRKQRTGLGIEQTPARVTHYEAFDLRATKSSYSDYYKKKPRNRNDMRREKQREWKRERRLRNELS